MRMLSFVLMALVGTMILGFPLQSYADAQLDILLKIATQARDNLSITISQTNNVPDEINQLYKQGSDETDKLAKAVDQQDVQSAKQHFLAAMKFFKETNDKLNSLNATAPNDQQKAEITQLRGEIIRLGNMAILLKTIATRNNIVVDFAKFDELIQTAIQDLDGGNINDAKTAVKNANDFLVVTHHFLATAAKERISERAKNFTEKQIERFSKMSKLNPNLPQNIAPPLTTSPPRNPSTVPTNTTGINTTSSIPPPPIPPPRNPSTVPTNTTGINTTSSIPPPPIPPPNPSTISPTLNYSSMVTRQNPEEMLAELKKLVSEGKVDEALKTIKIIEAYQKEKLKAEKAEQAPSATSVPNTVGNLTNSTSTTTTLPPIPPTPNPSTVPTNATGINTTSSIPPPPHPSTVPTNATGINTTSSTTPPQISTPTVQGDHKNFHPEKTKHHKGQQDNGHQDSNSGHD